MFNQLWRLPSEICCPALEAFIWKIYFFPAGFKGHLSLLDMFLVFFTRGQRSTLLPLPWTVSCLLLDFAEINSPIWAWRKHVLRPPYVAECPVGLPLKTTQTVVIILKRRHTHWPLNPSGETIQLKMGFVCSSRQAKISSPANIHFRSAQGSCRYPRPISAWFAFHRDAILPLEKLEW